MKDEPLLISLEEVDFRLIELFFVAYRVVAEPDRRQRVLYLHKHGKVLV